MMTKDTMLNLPRAAVVAIGLITAAGLGVAAAQTTPAQKPVVAAADNLLSMSDIESRLSAQGIKVREVEVRNVVLEVEGYDADGREVELLVDRRNGEILSHQFDR